MKFLLFVLIIAVVLVFAYVLVRRFARRLLREQQRAAMLEEQLDVFVQAETYGKSITCPDCGRTSFHPDDVKYGYCGHCHKFTNA